MHEQAVPYVLVLFFAAAVVTTLGLRAWSLRPAAGAGSFTLLMTGIAIWTIAYGFELGSSTLPAILFWDQLAFVGAVLVPAAWFTLAVKYTGRASVLAHWIWLLGLEPLLVLLLVWTNDWHHLFFASVELNTTGPFPVISEVYSFGFIAHIAYSYLLLLLGWLVLLDAFVRANTFYRLQYGAVLLGALLPWLGNLLWLQGTWVPAIDLTPFAFTLTGLIIALAFFRFHLLVLVPVAWAAVVERMSDGVIVLDTQSRIRNLNPAAQLLLGDTEIVLIGQPVGQVLPAAIVPLAQATAFAQANAEIVLGEGETTQIFQLRIVALPDQKHMPRGWLLVLHDVTADKHYAAELARAKAAAESASHAKSIFLATMSHELRTPLTVIMGYCDLLQMMIGERGPRDLLPEIARIRGAGEHLLGLVNNLLDLTKIEADKLELVYEDVSLPLLVDEVVHMSRPLMTGNRNTLSVQHDYQLDTIYTDRMRLRQVLINLIGNAAKFTHEGAITFAVVQESIDGRPWIQFRVADTGIGIPSDRLPYLFQPFMQADAAITRRYGGSGLGLALSQRFCQLLGGHLTVESELGKGSVFTVHLPLAPVGAGSLYGMQSTAQEQTAESGR